MSESSAIARNERRLVVASNRLPFTLSRGPAGLERAPSHGGLVSALEPTLRARGGTWVGWPGLELSPGERIPEDGDEPYRVTSLPLSDEESESYLDGFCNGTLWPLFHAFPDRTTFDGDSFDTYERVNQRFADAIVGEAGDGDLIWIHDYHLMLAPSQVHAAMPNARLAFFLHIPFPPYDIFRLLPWDREMLRGMLACELIGFHVMGYAHNFFDCVERRLGARVDRDQMLIEYGDHTVQVGTFPIGIEFERFERLAHEAPAREANRERIVLGVDRLDYTKGIPERIQAFETLLDRYPEHREKVVMLQIAVPSRSQVPEYRELKRQLDELVGQVNGRFATSHWSPIRYLYRAIAQEQLAAIYRDADVALVTPLRDGMNLVAKEYVAAQVEDPGVLILSQLAGAAETMREVLLVNPYDVPQTAEAIHRALTMDEPERRSRIEALRVRERRNDVRAWVQAFLETAAGTRAALHPLEPQDFERWVGPYLNRPRLALFLDYDGTLTELVDHPSKAKLSAPMLAALEGCAAREDTDVAIVSGRALSDVEGMVPIPKFTFAGNHGLEIKGHGIPDYRHEDLIHYRSRIDELGNALDKELAGDGAWTESKGPTLTFHIRKAPAERKPLLAARARELIESAGFQSRNAHEAIEARPPIGWDKGRAVLHILRARYGPGWSEQVRVVYVGDDQTDEDAFRFLSGLSLTFRVGAADTLTAASRRLAGVNDVQTLVQWIAGRPEASKS